MHYHLTKHDFLRKTISIFIIICILFTQGWYLPSSFAEESQNVSISVSPKPKIDIVLSKARSKTDTNNFEADIKQALIDRYIDPDDIQISAVSAEQVNIETAFTWQRDVDSSIGSLNIANNGQNVTMTGNQTLIGKNAIWIEPDGNQEQKFTFGYNIDFGDSFNAAGMLLRVKETDKTNHVLSGYMLSFNHPDSQSNYYTASSSSKGTIWKFLYDGNNRTTMNKTLVKNLSINSSGTLTVSATDSEIKVSGGGLSSEVTCEIDENYTTGNGFGFFSDHYSHNCTRIGSFQLSDINLTAVTTKSTKEVLQLPEWRSDSIRVLVNVDDYKNDEFDNQSAYSQLLTKLLNENIHYVAWGNSKNQQQLQELINANDSNGIFTSNTNYSNAINETADYIKEVVDRTMVSSQYVIVNDPISIATTPANIMNNTTDEEWPYGKWKIEHDYTFYENDLGQFAESGKQIDSLITSFNKTGKYQLYYKNIQVYPKEIYVHRKPIAQIDLIKNGTNITLSSSSYDLDELSKENKGISREEWKWKTSDQTSWTDGKLTTIDTSKDYIISLRVKDNQETWSNQTTMHITSDSSTPPIALFNVVNPTISKYEPLEINDVSYDPSSTQIVSRVWEYYKDNNLIYSGNTPKTDFTSNDIGEYTIYLQVTNASGTVSEKFGRKVTITDDDYAPEVVITPMSSNWGTSQTIHIEFSDRGGSGFKSYKYAITDTQSSPSTWSEEITSSSDNISIDGDGTKYLHIIAQDNAGNISNDRITGPYSMDNTKPIIEVTGNLNTSVLNTLTLHIKASDDLSGVKSVQINGTSISNDTDYTFTKNGTYTVVAKDNCDNTATKEIIINNIYYKCSNNLGHPNYSSSRDSCPICDEFEGLSVTNDTKEYNSQLQGIDYNNPKNATIVEYYNSNSNKVEDVGTYSYSLKVVYNGNEYNTGLDGQLKITPKELSIANIEAVSKNYDTNDTIQISGGTLIGVINGDDVSPIVPSTGKAESSNAGNWIVDIDEITLTGTDATNYTLKQPKHGDITVTINTISSPLVIKCDNKIYDGLEVSPSKVSGNNTSEVKYTYYEHGKNTPIPAPKNVGEYDVVGSQESDGNYNAITSERIYFKISPKELTIKDITTTNKNYDTNAVIQVSGGTLVGVIDGDNVLPIVPNTGKAESSNAGNWIVDIDEITLTGTDAPNYILKQPNHGDITVKIYTVTSPLVIKCDNKIYDGLEILPSKVSGNNTSPIIYTYYEHGKNTPIPVPKKVGEYDVIAYQITDGNYNTVTSDINTFSITPKELIIKDVTAVTKSYDTNDTVQISGGTLVGIVNGDDVSPIIPSTGKAESSNAGNWIVDIDEITLTGTDATNYTLKQLNHGDITVTITTSSVSLIIKCDSKVYDGLEISPSKVSGNNTSEVKYTYYEHGKNTPIPVPKNVGEYDVIASQESDGNYNPVSSEKIHFRILAKELTINDITAIDKSYDNNNTVQISGGTLVGIVDGDDVSPIIPSTGKAESSNAGNWIVDIDTISLTGIDSTNYTLKQPNHGDITVTITTSSVSLVIKCDGKVYDGLTITPSKVSGNNTSEVKYTYYEHGKNKPITAPKNVGEYDVVASQESDGNYDSVTSSIVTFKILPKNITIKGIEAEDKEYNSNKTVSIHGGKLVGIIDGDDVDFILPKTGEAESASDGTWNVKTGEIKLIGKDSKNYYLIQPDDAASKTDKITVTIYKVASLPLPKTGTLEESNIFFITITLVILIGIFGFVLIRKYIMKK